MVASLALGADHGRALGDAPQGLTQVGGAAHEGDREVPLVDVVGVIGGGENLRLVDVVDSEGLKDLSLNKVPDTRLGHDGDGYGVDDALDQVGIRHAGNAALGANVGGNSFEGHDRDGSGILGDLGLLGGHDVHDDAALEHLRHSALDLGGTNLALDGGFAHAHSASSSCARTSSDSDMFV